MTPESRPTRWSAGRLTLAAVLPIALLAVLITVIVRTRPGDTLRGGTVPPVERLAIERASLHPGQIVLPILNDGPDPVTIAQVIVDDAYWAFSASNGTTLGHLGRTTLTIPYPWVDGEAHLVKVLTSTGTTFEHEIAVAVESPNPDARYFFTFALVGLYVGVIPVALGLLWFPIASRVGPTGLDVLLAVTLGLLTFLLIDTVGEGLDGVAELPSSLQGHALFVAAALGAWLALDVAGAKLRTWRNAAKQASTPGAIVALLVAVGIGLHNFGEGLAIIAPIAREKPGVATLLRLGAIGGVPTIAGAWLGGLVHSPVVAVLCLGLGAGAIAQVIHQIARQMAGTRPVMGYLASAHIALGLLAGFAVMYATGLLVG